MGFIHRVLGTFHGSGQAINTLTGGAYGIEQGLRGYKTHHTTDAANAAAAAQKSTVDATNARIAKIRAMYGIDPSDVGGAGAYAGLAPEASNNKAVIDRLLGNQASATLKSGGAELDQRFSGVQRGNEQSLADRGLAGGSVDQGASRSTLADFLKGKQDLSLAASNQTATARGNLDQQRMQLEGQVIAGGDPTTMNTLTQQSNAINQAGANVVPNALAGVLQQGANTYAQGQVANAYGRRGLPGSTPYIPRATGSYT